MQVLVMLIILVFSPPDLSVFCQAGRVTLPGGQLVQVAEARLTFDPPEIREFAVTTKAPRNYADWYAPWDPWPKKGKDGKPTVIELKPAVDEEGARILSGLYRQVLSDSVVVTSIDGSKKFKVDVDYLHQTLVAHFASLPTPSLLPAGP